MELQDNEIAIVWSAEDVKVECKWLTDEQAMDVLRAIEHRHDATIGINWDVIRWTADAMFPEKKEEDDWLTDEQATDVLQAMFPEKKEEDDV